MTTGRIRRQHETTTIHELRGSSCSAFEAVRDPGSGLFGPLYLQLASVWHRFYLDAGLLFWEEGPGPDPENDLLEDEQYFDLADALHIRGEAVQSIDMHNCELCIVFTNGARLVLRHGPQSEGTELVALVTSA